MNNIELLCIGLSIFLLLSIFIIFNFRNKLNIVNLKIKKDLSLRKSREVVFGQSAEKLAPFLDSFGFDPQRSQFLGQPIDYIVFEEEEIAFIEVKTGKARLTKKQRDIKKLVEDKKITWKEVRI